MLYYNGAPYAPSVRYGCLNAARCRTSLFGTKPASVALFAAAAYTVFAANPYCNTMPAPGVAGDSAERRRGSRGGVYAGKQGGDPPRFYSRQRAIFFIPRAGRKALRCRQGGCIRSRRGCGRAGAVRRGGYVRRGTRGGRRTAAPCGRAGGYTRAVPAAR